LATPPHFFNEIFLEEFSMSFVFYREAESVPKFGKIFRLCERPYLPRVWENRPF